MSSSAAVLSYYFMLALFPFLLFLVAGMAYLPLRGWVGDALARLTPVMPPAALTLVRERLHELIQQPRPRLLTVGGAASLWTASRGVDALRRALNVAYEVTERRPWWKTQGIAVLVTVSGAVLFLAGFLMIAFGGRSGMALADRVHIDHAYVVAWRWIRWPLTGIVMMLTASFVYRFLPDVKLRFAQVTRGSLAAATIWIVATCALTEYSKNFSSYDLTYGSLAGVAFLMLWLYIAGIAIVLGGELNALLHRGGPRPSPEAVSARRGIGSAFSTAPGSISSYSRRRLAPIRVVAAQDPQRSLNMNGPAKDTSVGNGTRPADPAVTQAAFVEKAELELKEFTARMDLLTAKAEKLTAEAKATALKGIGELKPKLGVAREKLNAVKAAAGATWLDAKTGAESVWLEVKSLFEKHDSKPAS